MAKIDSIIISRIIGMESMKIALRMLPVVNSVSLPVTAVTKWRTSFLNVNVF